MTAITRGRSALAIVSVVALLVVSGCGTSKEDRGADSDASARPSVCAVVGIAQQRILAPAQITFTDLVGDEEWTVDERDGVAAIRLLEAAADTGRYEPLIDHLVARHRVEVGDLEGEPPPVTASLRKLAADLDEEAADDACG